MGLLLLPREARHVDCSLSRLAKLIRRGILEMVDRLHSVRVGAQARCNGRAVLLQRTAFGYISNLNKTQVGH